MKKLVLPLRERLLESHALECECRLCSNHLGPCDPFVENVVEILRRRGYQARGRLEPGGDAVVTAQHPYGLRHSVRFSPPPLGGCWGESPSGGPVSPCDVADMLTSRIRRKEVETLG